MSLFTVAEARAELARIRPTLDRLVAVRADAAELAAALGPGGSPTTLGARPELKAAEALLDELITAVQDTGARLKGLAPLRRDFPAAQDVQDGVWGWLEGDSV